MPFKKKKAKKKEVEFYSFNKLIKKCPEAKYYMVFSKRSNGKTYDGIHRILEDYVKSGYNHEGVYIRRHEKDIAGKAGDTDIATDVLTDTYASVFSHLQKQKEYSKSAVADEFYRALNAAIERYKRRSTETLHDAKASDGSLLADLCERTLDLDEQTARDDMLIKKAHSYGLQCGSTERKTFILYFYEGYTAQRIAKLLGIDESEVFGYLERTVSGIQNNFLAKYITK